MRLWTNVSWRGQLPGALVAGMLAACGGPAGPDEAAPALTVAIPVPSVEVGQTTQATAQLTAGSAIPASIAATWTSSAPAIATVSQLGEVLGVAPGVATIAASHRGSTATAVVTVTPMRVAHVVISPETSSLEAGSTLQLSATVLTQSGVRLPDRLVTWQLSDSSHASISTSGLVRATSAGAVTVRATCEGITTTLNLRITSAATSVARVIVSPTVPRVVVGDSIVFRATLEDAAQRPIAGRPVEWLLTVAAGSDVATLSADGVLRTRGPGRVVVEARAEGRVGSQAVEVVERLDPTITISFGLPMPGATVGDTLMIVADVNHRHALARVVAQVMDERLDMRLESVGRGALAWVGRMDLRLVRFGEHILTVTATDERGAIGQATIRFIRDPVKDKGGTTIPPKNK